MCHHNQGVQPVEVKILDCKTQVWVGGVQKRVCKTIRNPEE